MPKLIDRMLRGKPALTHQWCWRWRCLNGRQQLYQEWLEIPGDAGLELWLVCKACGKRRAFITDSSAHMRDFLRRMHDQGVESVEMENGEVLQLSDVLDEPAN